VAKCTKRDKQIRLNKVYAMMRDGKSRMQILEYARTTWGIGHSQVDKYRQEINEEMTREFEVSRKTMTVELADQLTRIVERCMESNQLAVALGAVNSKAKLFNLSDSSK
tara:strand:+ start:229 stop:555 length:327 start_codon:yes stop_codon:yes gene_type:complete